MEHFSRPQRGCRIYASQAHMTAKPGEFIGWCHKIDGSICIFNPPGSPELDRFIWRFDDGANPWFTYGP